MTIVAREPLAKSEVEIAIANVATMLVSASRMISGEVVPNFEAIVEQNELSFAQKHKDVVTVQALLTDEGSVVPMLQKAAEIIRGLHALSEAIALDTVVTVQKPAKPLPEGSLLRDTLRRLHYVQKVVEVVATWVNEVGDYEHLKTSVLYTKTQQELVRTFKSVVIQVQQATIIIGKYRDMGDIRVLREMTLDAQTVLDELKEADKSVSEKRKSISWVKRAVEESKSAPKIVRHLASATAGFATVVLLSFVVIKLHALVPQVVQSTSEPVVAPSIKEETQTSVQSKGKQEPLGATEAPIKSETDIMPREVASYVKREAPTPAIQTFTPPIPSAAPKPDLKQTNLKESKSALTQTKKSAPTKANINAPENRATIVTSVSKNTTNKPKEKKARKSAEQEPVLPKATEQTETLSQKDSERTLPKRKTIVIED